MFSQTRTIIAGVLLSACTSTFLLWAVSANPDYTMAQTFQGGTVQDGLPLADDINTGGGTDVRSSARGILFEIVSYVGLGAVTVIIIAGIILITSGGNDEAKERARKIIVYTTIGILVLLLSAAFVNFVITATT